MAFDLAGHGDKATRVRREIGFLAHKAGDGARADAAFQQVPAGRRVNVVEDSVAMIAVEIDEAWDELLIDSEKPDSAQPVAAAAVEKRIDPSRASFWPVEEGPSADESGSVVSVSLADVELIDGDPPASGERPASLLETALEGIESLIAQGRYDEASVLVVRYFDDAPAQPAPPRAQGGDRRDAGGAPRRSPARALRLRSAPPRPQAGQRAEHPDGEARGQGFLKCPSASYAAYLNISDSVG